MRKEHSVKVHRMGIVGTGTMGRNMMALLDAHPKFSVNAFYDASPDSLNKAKEAVSDAVAYQTFDEMISNAQSIECSRLTFGGLCRNAKVISEICPYFCSHFCLKPVSDRDCPGKHLRSLA